MWLLLLSACSVDGVPEDFDSLVRWTWVEMESAEDEAFNEAVERLHVLTDAETLEQPFDGGLEPLTLDEIAHLDLPAGTDPTITRGMVLVNPMACTLEQLEPVLYHLDQAALFPGVYESYERSYATDFEAFTSGADPFLWWDATMQATLLGNTYTETIRGGLRRVSGGERGLLIGRTHLPEPAIWDDPDWSFPQDYQIELYWERAPGELIHLHGIWCYMDLGGLTTDNDGVVSTTLNNMVDWDEQVVSLCAQGLP